MQEADQIGLVVSRTSMERLLHDDDGRWWPSGAPLRQACGPVGGREIDANGLAVQPQEQADQVTKGCTSFGWWVGRARLISVVSRTLPSHHLHPLTTCVTLVVRSARTLPLVALHLKPVCDDALRAMAMITTLAAIIRYCPAVFATHIVVLLPKATGGWRPIGLFISVLRVCLRWTRRAGNGLCQALPIWADSAHVPARNLEAQHGR